MIWTELQQQDTRMLYHYITSSLLPSSLPGAVFATSRGGNGQESNLGPFAGHQGRFLAGGPNNVSKMENLENCKPLKVFLHVDDSEQLEEYHLIVYHAVSSTVCLFMSNFTELTAEFYKTTDATMGPHLTNMSTDLLNVFAPPNVPTKVLSPTLSIPRNISSAALDIANSVRFLYFNDFNCAMKSTLQVSDAFKFSQFHKMYL